MKTLFGTHLEQWITVMTHMLDDEILRESWSTIGPFQGFTLLKDFE